MKHIRKLLAFCPRVTLFFICRMASIAEDTAVLCETQRCLTNGEEVLNARKILKGFHASEQS
jgi:hypothetical protein